MTQKKSKRDKVSKSILDSLSHHFEAVDASATIDCKYIARFKGKHLYLDFYEYGKTGPRCRLTFSGKIDDWELAIYKYSSETYSREEWMFPGMDHVDGTVEGAMKAALEAYS